MKRALMLALALQILGSGCANRPRWGLPSGQGTVAQQNARAAVHDPFPLNDIGPEVVGGRPRGYMNPLPEAKRNQITGPVGQPVEQFPPGFTFPR
jgi:hypothetical protein